MSGVFDGCSALERISVGKDFTLEFPESSTGYWISSTDVVYEPKDVPKGVADTYIAYYRRVEKPGDPSPLPYTGEYQKCNIPENDGYRLAGGTIGAVNPGAYQAEVKLNIGYIWSDGTTEPVTVNWSITEPEEPDNPNDPNKPSQDGQDENHGNPSNEEQLGDLPVNGGGDSGSSASIANKKLLATGDSSTVALIYVAAVGILLFSAGCLLYMKRDYR